LAADVSRASGVDEPFVDFSRGQKSGLEKPTRIGQFEDCVTWRIALIF